MLKYDINSHNGIGVNIVYLVGPILDKWISNMIFASQFKVSNVCIFNIESKSSRQMVQFIFNGEESISGFVTLVFISISEYISLICLCFWK